MNLTGTNGGPLRGLRVVELGGIGPGPHACMLLADLGAEVVHVQRVYDSQGVGPIDYMLRGRTVVGADLKAPADVALVLELVDAADVMVEGFRPGVAERLGLGPVTCLQRNPALVYGRMTGWGQSGPLARTAGHDINYIALTGVLDGIARRGEQPVPPLNLLGDYGGGSMFLVFGVLAALWERARSGVGQIVDAAICDGASVMAQVVWAMRGLGEWSARGDNLLDGTRPYYSTYECADGRYVAVGCIEPRFFAEMLQILGLNDSELPEQDDQSRSVHLREAISSAFKSRTMDEWTEIFAGTDACVTPVLRFEESLAHPHMVERQVFTKVDGIAQPRPAPRFSRTQATDPEAPRVASLAHVAWAPRCP